MHHRPIEAHCDPTVRAISIGCKKSFTHEVELALKYYSLKFFSSNRKCYQNAKAGETVKSWLITVYLAVTPVLEPPNNFMWHTAANPVSTTHEHYTHSPATLIGHLLLHAVNKSANHVSAGQRHKIMQAHIDLQLMFTPDIRMGQMSSQSL